MAAIRTTAERAVRARRLANRTDRGDDSAQSESRLRFHLFEKHRFSDPDLGVRRRYEDATRYAVRYLMHLEGLPPRNRLRSLRRFSRMTQRRKLRAIATAA